MPLSRGQVASLDGIFKGSGVAPVSCKIYDNIEEGDDYDSNEDIYSENSQPNSPSTPSLISREAFDPGVGRKRPASICRDDGVLVGTKRARLSSTSTMILKSFHCSRLPRALWVEIFSFLHPADLARQRRTCKMFQITIEDESIWRRSRKRYLPDYPRPVFGLTESEMLCIMWGSGCMLCEDGSNRRVGNTRLAGPKGSATPYWPFRVRCCKGCLGENTTKEFTLLSPTSPTAALLPALPFGIVDLRNNWISNPTHYQPNIGLTKIFWNADISDILERYREAIRNGAQEEWLNGLEAEGLSHKLDVMRIERFERLKVIARGTGSDDLSGVGYGRESRSRERQPKLLHEDYLQTQTHVKCPDQRRKIGQHGSASDANNQSINSQPQAAQHHTPNGPKNDVMLQLDTPANPVLVPMTRTPQDVTDVKAKRYSDIESCCLQLVPALEPGLLPHLPVFQAAAEIALPLDQHTWGNLKVKLLEQLPDTKEQEDFKRAEWHILQQHLQDCKALEQKQKESKERKEKEWDDFQIPVRQKLGVYADEVINRWVGSITKETAPHFAADVLYHCRRRFYDENPYSTDDPHHLTPLDTTTRVGQATLEVPTTRRLTLENMKFVFDNRIRPSTDRFGKELFLCSGCEYNPRFYAFEGVIQHYAAKHTSQLSVGPIVVHWKADWPAKPPFNPDPMVAGMVAYMTSAAPSSSQTKTNFQRQSCPSFHRTILHQPPSQYRSTISAAYNSTSYTGYVPPSRYQQMQHGIIQPHALTYPTYLEQIAKDAREAWFQLSGIKDLPPSVRIHYVISKTLASFQAIFSCEPPLTVFIESLREYASLKPVKNANGLLCQECYRNPPPPASDGISRVGRMFTFSALLQHFQTMHIARNRATLKPDWKTDMVKLPETRIIGMIRQAQGMDEEKYKLLNGVFALAFSLPLPGESFNKVINRASYVPTPEDRVDRPTIPKSMNLPEQKGMASCPPSKARKKKKSVKSSGLTNPYPLISHVNFRTIEPYIRQQTNNFPGISSADARPNDSIHHRALVPLAATTDHSHQNPQTVLDHQYLGRPIDPRYSYLEPSPIKIRDNSDRSIGPATIGLENCDYPPAPPEPSRRQKPAQLCPASDKPTMNAAERFLENFLRNTSDEQTPEFKGSDKRAMSKSPRIPRQIFKFSPLQSASPEYQEHRTEYSPKPGIDSRYGSEIGANFNRSREYSHEIIPLPLGTDQYDYSQSKPNEITPNDGSMSKYPSTGLQRDDGRARSPGCTHDNRSHRQPSINLIEKYNNHSYLRKDNTHSDKQYPPPLSNDSYHMKGTYWPPGPPVVYPVPPLPRMLSVPGYYDTPYGIDYRGRMRSRDIVPPLPHSPAQYSRYLPPRSLVPEIADRRRSRSPPVTTRSSQHVTMSYTSVSAPLSRDYGTGEDYRKMNGGNRDIYQQPRRDRREPGIVWQGRGGGGGGRGRGGRGAKTNSGR